MGQRRIGYTAGESLLLTVDRGSVIAYEVADGSIKWTFSVAREIAIIAVVYASTAALPSDVTAGPWRSPSSASTAVALDSAGVLHAIDAVLGRELGTVKHEGEPVALAGAGDALAVAFTDRVILYRAGTKHEIPKKATALAFSRDGLTLAIGTARGELFFVDIGTNAVTSFEPPIGGTISDVATRPGGGWLVSTERGLTAVYATKNEKQLNGLVIGAVVDSQGKRLAVHRSEANVVLYEWPPTVPVGRVSATGGTIRDIAFGPDDKLGVAMAGGGAAIIDPSTYRVMRTAQRSDEPRAVWLVSAESETERNARNEEQTRRAQAHEPKSGVGARLGIGGMISLAVLVIRIFLVGARASSPSWTPPPNFGNLPSYGGCGYSCELERLSDVVKQCDLTTKIDCKKDAKLALDSFKQDDCEKTRKALASIEQANAAVPGGGDALLSADQMLATLGLTTACRGLSPARTAPHDVLTRLAGPRLEPVVDPSLTFSPGDAHAVWASSDGVLFLATRHTNQTCDVQRQTGRDELWKTDLHEIDCSGTISFFGRSSREVYLSLGMSIRRFNGKDWADRLDLPVLVGSIGGTSQAGSDVFALAAVDEKNRLFQLNGKSFAEFKVANEGSIAQQLYGGPSLWAYGETDTTSDLMLRWNGRGWSQKSVVLADSGVFYRQIHDLWQGPNGQMFLAMGRRVARSSNDGATWSQTELSSSVEHIWGRSNTDVYAGGTTGLLHFDGKTWTELDFSGEVASITGDAKDLYVLTVKR